MLIDKVKLYYLYIPALIILFPTFPTILKGQGEQLIFFVQFISFIIFTKIKIPQKQSLTSILILLSFFFILCLSIFMDIIKEQVIGGDFVELCRPIIAFYFYIFYRYSDFNILKIEKTFEKLISFVFTILAIYVILEFIFPHLIRPISFFLYKRESLPILKNKAIGSFSQTYNFAYILILPTIYGLNKYIKTRNYKSLSFFIICFLSILLSQSRSMYITFALALASCWFMPIYKKNAKNIFYLIGGIIIITIGIYFLYLTYEHEI